MFSMILISSNYVVNNLKGEIKIEVIDSSSRYDTMWIEPVILYDKIKIFEIGREGNTFRYSYEFKEKGFDVIDFRIFDREGNVIGNRLMEIRYEENKDGKINEIRVKDDIMLIFFEGRGEYSVEIYDISGRKIIKRTGFSNGGWERIRFDRLKSGIYFYRVSMNKQIKKGKMMILKGGMK